MPPKLTSERIACAVVIILFVIILVLLLASPPEFADIRNAYQGF